jgi:hypothetical protein
MDITPQPDWEYPYGKTIIARVTPESGIVWGPVSFDYDEWRMKEFMNAHFWYLEDVQEVLNGTLPPDIPDPVEPIMESYNNHDSILDTISDKISMEILSFAFDLFAEDGTIIP